MFDQVRRWMSSPARAEAPRGPDPAAPHSLVLYQFASCPYCRRVLQRLPALGLEVTLRDTMRDRAAADELRQATGRGQVPCLFIDGEPMFESADIIDFLEAHAAAIGAKGA